ncbi:MAG: ADP-ribosylglycohydrolase family protein [Prolixibacteraceae bacterium]
MKNYKFLLIIVISILCSSCEKNKNNYQRISTKEFRDKMKAAWVGQMAGVGWGLPTEFDYTDKIIPSEEVPEWNNEMINQHGNDDIYVEMTFLASMDKYGLDVSNRQAGIDFANTGYTLWAANKAGRENLRYGIAPPESSHPQYSDNCDDIDYQIEADYSGIIAPGMPNIPVELGEKFGRLMNYGDGLYGGQFVGSMYSVAYFEDDIERIIETALQSIPQESHYATCVRDVLTWYREEPEDWQKTWHKIEEKYHHSKEYQQFAAQTGAWVPIDAKLNGAYIVLGLLYGKGDMDSTIVISMRGGKDSDCNPSNAAGVLATTIGYKNLPEKFKTALDEDRKFSYSEYNFNDLMELSEKFAREFVVRNGGKMETRNGEEYFLIPVNEAEPSRFQPSYDPGTFDADNRYTNEEMAQIKAWSVHHFEPLFKQVGLNMEVRHCGKTVSPEIKKWNGKDYVIATAPMSNERGVKMLVTETNAIPEGKSAYLQFSAGHEEDQQWRLLVGKGRENIIDTEISKENSNNGWQDFKIDVSEFAGKENIGLTFFAENIADKPAVNYWGDWKIVVEQN